MEPSFSEIYGDVEVGKSLRIEIKRDGKRWVQKEMGVVGIYSGNWQ